MATVLDMSVVPEALRAQMEANRAELKKLAGKLGGKTRAIDKSQRATWTVPGAPFDDASAMSATVRGVSVEVIANIVRRQTRRKHGPPTWSLRHIVGVRLPKAEVASALDTLSYTVPVVGELRVPHFFYASDADRTAEHAWTLPSGYEPPKLDGLTLAGCYSGVLYAKLDANALDTAAIERAIDALVEASSQPWIAPTPAEREARRRASMRRGRVRLVLTCSTILIALGLATAGLVWLASNA